MKTIAAAVALIFAACLGARADGPARPWVRSAGGGAWSHPGTWEGGAIPAEGDRVSIRPGHDIRYDADSPAAIRSIHVAGTLRFAHDRDTALTVGLIAIEDSDDPRESGFDCDGHVPGPPEQGRSRPGLIVGTADAPIAAGHRALIRLAAVEGLDPASCPAIVCCGGRMQFYGAPLGRSWARLAAVAKAGDTAATLDGPVPGWRVGDRVILAGTGRVRGDAGSLRGPDPSRRPETEMRTVVAVDGPTLTLDAPLEFDHLGGRGERGEVADLSRNVVVESADPAKARGHTMYHRHSTGSIEYAEFRHLGKEGVRGRYPIHFHKAGDTMRGASVVGASIWDSGNRWLTIHDTDYLVVRDCVGYRSVGHGFFLEDGTEVDNVLDGNLAVQAFLGKPLPGQDLPFDDNAGAGFWWANSLNTFARNAAAECDRYGYRFEATPGSGADLCRPVRRPDGTTAAVDIRTLPFVRFEGNSAHSTPYGLDLGEGVGGVGPPASHPFLIRDLTLWNTEWAFEPGSPSVRVDGLAISHTRWGVFRPAADQAYRRFAVHQAKYAGGGESPLPESAFRPADDRPPTTVITRTRAGSTGHLLVEGASADAGMIRRVVVNGRRADATGPNFATWAVTLTDTAIQWPITAHAEDDAGRVEPTPHVLRRD